MHVSVLYAGARRSNTNQESPSYLTPCLFKFRPSEFAQNINLSLDNCWGILRVVCEFLLSQPTGKYLLMKDPTSPVVRIYALPEGTFDSTDDEESEQEDNESDDED